MAAYLWKMCQLLTKTNLQSVEERGKWESKTEFILSVMGATIGLGNVWRFPYLCYKNGGGAFFIPYSIFLVTCGIPMFILETSLGQYTSQGGIMCWGKVCPLFEGLGYASQMIIFYASISYIVILAWAFLYFFTSFSAELPWTSCNNAWNTEDKNINQRKSQELPGNFGGATAETAKLYEFMNIILLNPSCDRIKLWEKMVREHCVVINSYNGSANWTSSVNASLSSSVLEFWQRRVLNISTGIETLGNLRWDLSLCLLLSWIICYFCVWKGVRSTGKATYFTATLPLLLLVLLFLKGVTLPGALHGIKYYLYPNPERLADPQVWVDAGTQIFYSFALCLGFLTSLGSYNKYNNDCYRDSFYLCLVNTGISFLSGFVVFSILGYMSQMQGVDISTVAESGPGLVFIVYPQAVTLLPWPQFWSICFFSMIIFLGVDSQFVGLESIVTSVSDLSPSKIRMGYRRELFLLLLCACSFFLGLFLVSEAGIYILQIFDHYVCSGPTLLMMAIFQSVTIGWIYGAERFSDNIEDMIGYKPLPLIKYCWMYAIPLLCFGSFVFLLLRYNPMKFNNSYVYPWWAYCIGWFLSLSSLCMIPINMVWKLAKGKGTIWERLKTSSQAADDLPGMSREMRNHEAALTEYL